MTQKPVLRVKWERAFRVKTQNVGGWFGKRGKCNAFGSWVYARVSVAFKGRGGVVSFLVVVQAPSAGVKLKTPLIPSTEFEGHSRAPLSGNSS